ncbi:class I SAM-dependent methyltransferase [Thalassospiraceae bacterium LMO-SO8]|nr:class I SAM-dependent methyltransferase [Alphaproteobacteria bacterium LMO-S08]WND74848.1 class I SAM-dependent methyltransferase [Thalassospiraceae bacterium LMO-SO8]
MTLFFFKRAARLLKPVARSYERRLAELGPDARAVFWKSEDHQLVRFETLYQVIDDVDARAGGLSIADFGCGYGALFDFLKDTPALKGGRYVGYDMSKKMVEAARARIRDPRARFLQQITVTEPADYVFACGTYNMHMGADGAEWGDYVKDSLRELWAKTNKILAFNLLRADAVERYQGLFYVDGGEFLNFCRTELSPRTTVTNDDPLPDYTFIVRR